MRKVWIIGVFALSVAACSNLSPVQPSATNVDSVTGTPSRVTTMAKAPVTGRPDGVGGKPDCSGATLPLPPSCGGGKKKK